MDKSLLVPQVPDAASEVLAHSEASLRAHMQLQRQMASMPPGWEQLRDQARAAKELEPELDESLALYETLRKDMNQVLHKIFDTSTKISNLTGRMPPKLPEALFMEINIPTLRPTNAWLNTGYSTTRMGIAGYQATFGKTWGQS